MCEPIEMSTRLGPRNHVLSGDPDPTPGEGVVSGETFCDAAFQQNSLATCLWLPF